MTYEPWSGYVYALVLDNGLVKVGQSYSRLSLATRLGQHKINVRAFGRKVVFENFVAVDSDQFTVHERALMALCAKAAVPNEELDSLEWFQFSCPKFAEEFLVQNMDRITTLADAEAIFLDGASPKQLLNWHRRKLERARNSPEGKAKYFKRQEKKDAENNL